MSPINLSAPRMFRPSHLSRRSRDRNELVGNEAVSERDWDIGGNMEQDMNDDTSVLHDDMSDDFVPMTSGVTNFDLLGPEIESFAQCLDATLSRAKSETIDAAAAETSYKLIQQYHSIALHRLEQHHMAWGDVEFSTSKVENGRELALDHSGNWVDIWPLEGSMRYWELETDTWDLFLILCRHRFSKERRLNEKKIPDEINHQYSSNLKFREVLLHSDAHFKELNLILDWVKRKAPIPVGLRDMRSAGWAYTKERLKTRKRLRHSGGLKFGSNGLSSATSYTGGLREEDLVTELDPDAPARQDKYLEEEDISFERNLMLSVWQHLRAGDLQGAMSKCKEANDLWRAQSLAGIIDAWDTEIDGPKEGALGLEGNRHRELWRRMCYRLAKESSDEEAAVYGVLSGDLESVLPLCKTWDDFLFAHLNSLVECHYSNFLSSQHRISGLVENFPIYNAIKDHGAADHRVFPQIVDSLYNNKDIEAEAHESLHIIQGGLISDRVNVIVSELSRQLDMFKKDPGYEPISDSAWEGLSISDFRMLRVVVHILLILNDFGAGSAPGTTDWNIAENVIAGYIDLLAEAGKHDLIPLYASQLSRNKTTSVMGEILMKVIDEDTRLTLLGLMRSYDIDVAESLKRMMAHVFHITKDEYYRMPMPKSTGILGDTTTGIKDQTAVSEEDEAMIRALEWMLLVDELRSEIARAGCVIYKRFLMTGKLSSARELFRRVPSTAFVPTDQKFEDPENTTAAIMYIEFDMLMKGILALEDWKDLVHKVPETRRERAHKADFEAAYEAVERHALPIPKSWMAHFIPPTDIELSEHEVDQIVALRNAYIPDFVLALHQVYLDAGRLLHRPLLTLTLELAAIVGSNTREGNNIVNCFMETGRLKEYVDKIAEASRQILGATQLGGREVTRRGVGSGGGAALNIWNVK